MPEALGHLDRAVLRPVRDGDVAIPRPSAAFSVCSPIRPAPTTRTCFSRRSPSAPSASASAIELAVAGFAPIAVSERARRPQRSRCGRGASVRARPFRPPRPELDRVTDLAEDLRLAEDERVEAGCDAAQVARDVLSRVHVEVVEQELARDVVRVERASTSSSRASSTPEVESRVELDAVARLQHRCSSTAGQRSAPSPSAPMRSRSSTGAVRWLSPRQTRRCTPADPTAARSSRMLHARARHRRRRTFTDAVLVEDGRSASRRCRRPRGRRSPSSRRGGRRRRRTSSASRMARRSRRTRCSQRRGARTALVTNEGFEHVLHLRRQTRAHLYRPCVDTRRRSSARALRRRARAHGPGRRARPARP